MTRWTALVPLKPAGARKTRLAPRLSAEARDRLAMRLLHHLQTSLARLPRVTRTVLLTAPRPEAWIDDWLEDCGRGLNPELTAARAMLPGPLLVLPADLPLVTPADITAVLDAAEAEGCAIAPDQHRSGTNALALADARPFAFTFGADSFALHQTAAGSRRALVEREGLMLDIDTPVDLDRACTGGFVI